MRAETFPYDPVMAASPPSKKLHRASLLPAAFRRIGCCSITLYMLISGTPALFKVGLLEILFGTVWQPAAASPSFGILFVILTSIVGTFLAILIGVPIAS